MRTRELCTVVRTVDVSCNSVNYTLFHHHFVSSLPSTSYIRRYVRFDSLKPKGKPLSDEKMSRNILKNILRYYLCWGSMLASCTLEEACPHAWEPCIGPGGSNRSTQPYQRVPNFHMRQCHTWLPGDDCLWFPLRGQWRSVFFFGRFSAEGRKLFTFKCLSYYRVVTQ